MKLFLAIVSFSLVPVSAAAQTAEPIDEYMKAKVMEIVSEEEEEFAGMTRMVQRARLRLAPTGKEIEIENGILNERQDMRLSEGQTVVIERLVKPDGTEVHLVRDAYRIPALIAFTVFFFVLGVLLGGRIGFTSILGLLASIAILVLFVVPRIVAGDDPLLISMIGSALIACTSLYIAHGFNRRITIALYSTVITLLLSTLMAVAFVHFGQLFGLGSEESMFLQLGAMGEIDLRGLLLGGIIIGALGVLDDITTAQTAAIDELSKANHKLGVKELYAAGTSIGREHIAALINTLALAYIGTSLPLFLLFYTNASTPFWVTINSEFLAEEIVRTLVGSATLLLAVPISTYLAARSFAYGKHTNVKGGHSH